MLPLAQQSTSSLSWEILVLGGVQLLTLLSLLPTVIKSLSGRADERQIEPTQLAAISTDIQSLESVVGSQNRELGEIRSIVERTEEAMRDLADKQDKDANQLHEKINSVAIKVANHDARISALERFR